MVNIVLNDLRLYRRVKSKEFVCGTCATTRERFAGKGDGGKLVMFDIGDAIEFNERTGRIARCHVCGKGAARESGRPSDVPGHVRQITGVAPAPKPVAKATRAAVSLVPRRPPPVRWVRGGWLVGIKAVSVIQDDKPKPVAESKTPARARRPPLDARSTPRVKSTISERRLRRAVVTKPRKRDR